MKSRAGEAAAMTESQWRTGTDPAPLLDLLQDASPRKLRLFACACCRAIWPLLPGEVERATVAAAERYADGLITDKELHAPAAALPHYLLSQDTAAQAARACALPGAWTAARRARAFAIDAVRAAAGPAGRPAAWQRQCELLRCVFGNLFRPLLPLTFPAHVLALAELIRADFPEVRSADYGILADALADLGQEDAAAHCRGATHARGCHVIDWILEQGLAAQATTSGG
jgi:hypothetical protein